MCESADLRRARAGAGRLSTRMKEAIGQIDLLGFKPPGNKKMLSLVHN
jgi:hypothetical protein